VRRKVFLTLLIILTELLIKINGNRHLARLFEETGHSYRVPVYLCAGLVSPRDQ
jgi:hypothetical protein